MCMFPGRSHTSYKSEPEFIFLELTSHWDAGILIVLGHVNKDIAHEDHQKERKKYSEMIVLIAPSSDTVNITGSSPVLWFRNKCWSQCLCGSLGGGCVCVWCVACIPEGISGIWACFIDIAESQVDKVKAVWNWEVLQLLRPACLDVVSAPLMSCRV